MANLDRTQDLRETKNRKITIFLKKTTYVHKKEQTKGNN